MLQNATRIQLPSPAPTFLQILFADQFSLPGALAQVNTTIWPAFYASLIYVVVIFSIKAFMAGRKPYELTRPLNLWNGWLAVFSTLGAIVTGRGLLAEIAENGVVHSYCKFDDNSFFLGSSGFWVWIFSLSKLAELGDTLFVVLRKKPLMFLHWYHHVLTLNYALISFVAGTGFNSWITWLNLAVHSVMYGYYTLRSLGVKIPAALAQSITSAQILQFLITLVILIHVGVRNYVLGSSTPCDVTPSMYLLCLGMELSYIVLFGNFFYQSYVKGGGKKYNAEKKAPKKIE